MKALILIDLQNEWLDNDSDYFAGDLSDMLARTNKLIDHARKAGDKIIFIRHVEEESEGEFKDGTENAELIASLDRQDSDIVITKYRISPFYNTDLEKHIDGIEEVTIAGILSNLCVRSCIHDAYDRDFAITVITDCCVSFDEATQDFTFDDIKQTREEVQFVTLDDYVASSK